MTKEEMCPMCQEDCKEIVKLAAEQPPKFIECPMWSKLYMFARVPEGFKKATRYDVMINEEPKIGLSVIIQSFYSPIYLSYKITSSTEVPWLMEFVKAGKCFVR